MKKLVMLSSVLLVALVLVGCKPQEEVCENNAENGILYEFDQNQTEITTLKVWFDDEDYATAIIEAFEADNPDIKVEWENVSILESRQRLETYSGSSYAPDVAIVPHDQIGAALNSNLLYPFPDSLRTNIITRMINSAVGTATSCYDSDNNTAVACDDAGTYESELFGAPLSGESVALFYNKTLLEEITGSAVPEASIEEILETALTWNQTDDPATEEDETRVYFVTRPSDAYFMHPFATAFGFELFGEDHQDKSQVNLNSQAIIDALTFIQDTFAPAALGLNSDTLDNNYQTMFEEQRAVYMINGPWALNSVKEAAENGGFELGVAKLPTLNGNDMISFSGVQLVSVYKGTSNPTAAFAFAEFILSDEGLSIYYEHQNRLPALKDVSGVAGVSEDPYLVGIISQMAYSETMPMIPEMGFYWGNSGPMYRQAWNGTQTPEEAANEAQAGFAAQAELN